MREVSLAAGCGAGYLHSILVEGKDPSVERLARVAEVVGVSLSYLLYGIEMSAETERLLQLIEKNPDARAGILKILGAA